MIGRGLRRTTHISTYSEDLKLARHCQSTQSQHRVARGITCRVGYPPEQYYIVLDAQIILNEGHPDGLSLWATM